MGWFGKNEFQVQGKTVLITGGSQGMGRGVAKLLSSKGASVVLVARNAAKLEAAVEYITAAALHPQKQRFHSISADVTQPTENERILREVCEWNNGQQPDIVWAIAGGAMPSLFLEASTDTMRKQMDLNYWSAVYLAQSTLRGWIYRSSGNAKTSGDDYHFIMTSSVGAFVGLAGYAPYAPGKAALRSLHDNLRSEMNVYNGARSKATATQPYRRIRIHTIFPGTILSPGLETENEMKPAVTKLLEEDDTKSTEDEVAAGAVAKLERGHEIITTNLLSDAMRATSMQGSIRDNWVVDTLFAWICSLVWLFVSWDMERKTWRWGVENGLPAEKQV